MIYTITCMTRLEKNENGWPEYGALAFMGYYKEKDTAIQAVKENWADIAERCYDYAVVEEIDEGLYSLPRRKWFFKYDVDKDIYNEIEEPDFMKHIANIL